MTEKIYLRASACVLDSNSNILLFRENDDDYWILPGGGVKASESALDAVIRELEEEIGIRFTVNELSLMNVTENFFTKKQNEIHEFNLIFTCKLNDKLKISLEKGVSRKYEWVNSKKAKTIKLMPPPLIEIIFQDESCSYEVFRD